MKPVKQYQLTDFLPTTKKELELRGWNEVDVVLFSGDAYIDHPSFGSAVIGRMLEAQGLKVAIVPQPNWSITIRPINGYVRMMPIHLTGKPACVLIMQQ